MITLKLSALIALEYSLSKTGGAETDVTVTVETDNIRSAANPRCRALETKKR